MSPQIRAVVEDLTSAACRLTRLAQASSAEVWRHQPAPGRWSAHQCVDHLNLMSEALLLRLRAALADARAVPGPQAAAYRRDWMGWLVARAMTPGGGMKTRTVEKFWPSSQASAEVVLTAFARLQADLVDLVREADGAALDAVRITSPYDARVRYNVYSALVLIARHQHRHVLQAERAAHHGRVARSAVAV